MLPLEWYRTWFLRLCMSPSLAPSALERLDYDIERVGHLTGRRNNRPSFSGRPVAEVCVERRLTP
jgi:hypothetical protein